MPPPSPSLPFSPAEQEGLLNQLLGRLRGLTVTAVAGVFDRLNVGGDINARNLILSGNSTVRGNSTITGSVKAGTVTNTYSATGNFTNTLIGSPGTQINFGSVTDPGNHIVNSQFVVPITGWYLVGANVMMNAAATCTFTITIQINANVDVAQGPSETASGFFVAFPVTLVKRFAAGDKIFFFGTSATSNQPVNPDSRYSFGYFTYLGS